MQDKRSTPPKPVSEIWRPERVRLPELTPARRIFRLLARGLLKLVAWICLRVEVDGLENFPKRGPLLVVINHLGDADTAVLLSYLPIAPDALGKIELYDFPILGKLIDWYGVIWVHRGQPDKRALRAALDGLAQGRAIIVAPEGRYTLTGGLEEGSGGAAYLALKANVPVLPIVLTGTENTHVYGHMRRLRRARVTLRVGELFNLAGQADRHAAMREGTRQIMESLASLLPNEYRGSYRS
jgi:1-acyl-sn-glycerol-3-phosphate acyltransferase